MNGTYFKLAGKLVIQFFKSFAKLSIGVPNPLDTDLRSSFSDPGDETILS